MVLSIQKQRDNLAQNPDKLGISAQYEAPVVLLKKWVDFEWEVDGKTYEYSLTGGGYLSFTELMELLCVADSDDVENFVSQVESVEFSNPDLVWVGKVEEDTTVGALKEANGLDVQYSAELTEEQILQIEAQTVKAGDWALLSLLPFDTEESLMIILQNGDEFTIKVTDAAELTLGLGGLSGLQSGTKFIIYIFDSDTKMEYVLKGNGETDPFDGTLDFHTLGDEYQWTITKDSSRNNYYTIYNEYYNRYIHPDISGEETLLVQSSSSYTRIRDYGNDMDGFIMDVPYSSYRFVIKFTSDDGFYAQKVNTANPGLARIRLYSLAIPDPTAYTITAGPDSVVKGKVSCEVNDTEYTTSRRMITVGLTVNITSIQVPAATIICWMSLRL